MEEIIFKYKDYINSLDIYINSHGGVGSNYLADFLYSSGFNVNCEDNNFKIKQRSSDYRKDLISPSLQKCIAAYNTI